MKRLQSQTMSESLDIKLHTVAGITARRSTHGDVAQTSPSTPPIAACLQCPVRSNAAQYSTQLADAVVR